MNHRGLKSLLNDIAEFNRYQLLKGSYGQTGGTKTNDYKVVDITKFILAEKKYNPLHFAAFNNSLKAL